MDNDGNGRSAIVLVDSNNVASRAAFVAPHEDITECRFDMLDNMIRSKRAMLERMSYAETTFVYVFDEPRCDYVGFSPKIDRRALIGDYKGTRPGMTDEATRLRTEWIQAWMQSLASSGEYVLAYPGAEADDFLAYMSGLITGGRDPWYAALIWSNDKDILQCVDDDRGIAVIGRRKGEKSDSVLHGADVIERKGVSADRIRLQLTLQGDSADNYHGLRGYGGKKGLDIINGSSGRLDDIIGMFPAEAETLKRNWALAGVGADYLGDKGIDRAKRTAAMCMGPAF